MPMQETDTNATLNLILNGLTAVKGKSNTSTSTTSSNISGEGMNAMIKQILESTQGLAQVSSGQKSAGLYNSSTNQLLVNDLLTRASGEVQKLSAGSTTTQTNKQNAQVGGRDVGTLLALQIGAKLFGPTLKEGYNKLGVDKWGENIAKMFGGGGEAGGSIGSLGGAGTLADSVSSGGSFPLASSMGGDIFGAGSSLELENVFSPAASSSNTVSSAGSLSTGSTVNALSAAGTLSDAYSGVEGLSTTGTLASSVSTGGSFAADASMGGDMFGNLSAASDVSAVSSAGDIFGGSGSSLGYLGSAAKAYQASQTDGDYREAVGSAILNYFGAGWATPVVSAVARPVSDSLLENGYDQNGVAGAFMNEPLGAIFSGDYEFKDILSGVSDPMNLFGGNEGGSVGGFIGQSVDPVGSWFGEGIGPAIADKVICTELNRQGLLNDRYYAACALYALSLSPETIKGYHSWGVPVARYLRTSPLASKIFLYLVESRCEYLMGHKRFWGMLSVRAGEPICALLGKFVKQSNWRTLYA